MTLIQILLKIVSTAQNVLSSWSAYLMWIYIYRAPPDLPYFHRVVDIFIILRIIHYTLSIFDMTRMDKTGACIKWLYRYSWNESQSIFITELENCSLWFSTDANDSMRIKKMRV